jgi:hypothetical protein
MEGPMDRIGKKSHGFAEAEAWDIQQCIEMTPEERQEVARLLRLQAHGENPPDVRQSERERPRAR